MDETISPLPKLFCPSCHTSILPAFYFCPNCGKALRPKPLSTSLGKQISVYLISFFLPPFGLGPAFRYLSQKGALAKTIGIVAILLTTFSLAVAVYYCVEFFHQVNQIIGINSLNQLQGY